MRDGIKEKTIGEFKLEGDGRKGLRERQVFRGCSFTSEFDGS